MSNTDSNIVEKRLQTTSGPESVPIMPESNPTLENCFRILRHPERQQLLRQLDQQQTARTAFELADALADNKKTQSGTATVDHIALRIQHQHLPLLVETHFADRTTQNLVKATDHTTTAVEILETATDIFR